MEVKKYQQLSEADFKRRYKMDNKILGVGTVFVKLGIDINTNEQVAIKVIKAEHKIQEAIQGQIRMLKSISHQNIVKLLSTCRLASQLYIIMEYCQSTLEQFLSKTLLEDEKAMEFTDQLFQAICYLHKNQVIHRDLKPANIMLKQGNIKVVDFGFSRYLSAQMSLKGTPLYSPPQYLKRNRNYDLKYDVWSIGMVIYEIWARKRLLEALTTEDVEKKHDRLRVNKDFLFPTENSKQPEEMGNLTKKSPQLVLLLKKMVSYEPQNRPTIEEAYNEFKKIKPRLKVNIRGLNQLSEDEGKIISSNQIRLQQSPMLKQEMRESAVEPELKPRESPLAIEQPGKRDKVIIEGTKKQEIWSNDEIKKETSEKKEGNKKGDSQKVKLSGFSGFFQVDSERKYDEENLGLEEKKTPVRKSKEEISDRKYQEAIPNKVENQAQCILQIKVGKKSSQQREEMMKINPRNEHGSKKMEQSLCKSQNPQIIGKSSKKQLSEERSIKSIKYALEPQRINYDEGKRSELSVSQGNSHESGKKQEKYRPYPVLQQQKIFSHDKMDKSHHGQLEMIQRSSSDSKKSDIQFKPQNQKKYGDKGSEQKYEGRESGQYVENRRGQSDRSRQIAHNLEIISIHINFQIQRGQFITDIIIQAQELLNAGLIKTTLFYLLSSLSCLVFSENSDIIIEQVKKKRIKIKDKIIRIEENGDKKYETDEIINSGLSRIDREIFKYSQMQKQYLGKLQEYDNNEKKQERLLPFRQIYDGILEFKKSKLPHDPREDLASAKLLKKLIKTKKFQKSEDQLKSSGIQIVRSYTKIVLAAQIDKLFPRNSGSKAEQIRNFRNKLEKMQSGQLLKLILI